MDKVQNPNKILGIIEKRINFQDVKKQVSGEEFYLLGQNTV
jgi:hypothetical protein